MAPDHTIIINENQVSLSSLDQDRVEALWDDKQEILFQNWAIDIKLNISKHHKLGKKNKHCHIIFSTPSILIPIILSGLTTIITNPLISSLLLILSGTTSGLCAFFDFSARSIEHHDFENRFINISMEIELELSKSKKDRVAVECFAERIYQQVMSAKVNAPRY